MAMIAACAALLTTTTAGFGQAPVKAPLPKMAPPPASAPPAQVAYDSEELERITSPVALYPDALLAQVLTAATYPSQIPVAESWVENHRGLTGPRLADALATDQVSWDPSVQALVAFPTVLGMMADAMPWTTELGDAFQSQHADVMDAVQRLRTRAERYGYLQSTSQLRVTRGPYIEIYPVNPEYIVVPYYDPYVVFYAPAPRFVVSRAIYFGYGVRLGLWYEPWGLWSPGFAWGAHRVVARYPGWNHPFNYSDFGRPVDFGRTRGLSNVRSFEGRPTAPIVGRPAALPSTRAARPPSSGGGPARAAVARSAGRPSGGKGRR